MFRYLSGIQPSGNLHLGNYFGAIREHVRLMEKGDAYYFIADYHALTTVRNAAQLREFTRDTAITYLACGLDPDRCTLFRQSDVPEVCELTWLLLTVTPMSLLEKAHSYKDKTAKGIAADCGLFTYPVLMAADILAQNSHIVPVGKDQKQHVEMTRDIAQKFNQTYNSPVFVIPDIKLGEAPYVPGTDGEKMSKSYKNALDILGDSRSLEKAVMSIKTDSLPPEAPKDPTLSIIYQLYALAASPEETDAFAAKFRAGGMGYGTAKKELFQKLDTMLTPFRKNAEYWKADPFRVETILAKGAMKARENARFVLENARRACGLG